MKKWILTVLFFSLSWPGRGQDMESLLEQAPIVSAIILKAIEKGPSFSAAIQLTVSGRSYPNPTIASGAVQSQKGKIRWEVKLADIKSAQFTDNARAIVKQINGDRLVLLTRADAKSNCLLLPGARAFLEEELPHLKLAFHGGRSTSETIDGCLCVRERFTAHYDDGKTNEVVIWRAKSLKNLPVQVEIANANETFRVRFKNVLFRAIPIEAFEIAPKFARYTSLEDLTQSVLLEKLKRRMGIQ